MWKSLVGTLALGLLACSADTSVQGAPEFTSAPYAHVVGASAATTLDVRTSPQPPRAGVIAVELRIAGRDGEPIDGLTLDVTPRMVAHGHGSTVHPNVEARGGGVYVVRDVSVYMAGTWELRTTIRGSTNDDATIVLDVR